MTTRTAPCDWPLATYCDALDDLDDGAGGEGEGGSLRDAVIDAATAYLWRWTGKRFGLCDVVLRPCRSDCDWQATTYRGYAGRPDRTIPTLGDPAPFVPALIGGVWRNLSCWSCGEACSCERTPTLVLPGPVEDVVEIVIDGEVVPASAYRVDNRNRLVRDDGAAWPTCQDLSLPAGEVGTWTVTYRWGVPVPAGGEVAAAVLACEMAKALNRDRTCQLPERITNQVTREGITVTILDQFEQLEAGRTGLWLVDSWVTSIRSPDMRSGVYSPDRRRTGARTTYRGV